MLLVQEKGKKKRSNNELETKREVFKIRNQNLSDGNVPSLFLTIDEQLVSFRRYFAFC